MHLDEVERVVWELVGYLVPLHGCSAGTVARPTDGEEEEQERGSKQLEAKVKQERQNAAVVPLLAVYFCLLPSRYLHSLLRRSRAQRRPRQL